MSSLLLKAMTGCQPGCSPCTKKKNQKIIMLFSDHDGSLLRRQPRASHVLATIIFREKVTTADLKKHVFYHSAIAWDLVLESCS